MEINKEFDGLKFFRTYIGGSKKDERYVFELMGGVEEDASDCDWIEYKRLLIHVFDDKLHIILSWKWLANNARYYTAAAVLPLLLVSHFAAMVFMVLSVVSHLLFLYLNHKQQREQGFYGLCMSIINYKISEIWGINLT